MMSLTCIHVKICTLREISTYHLNTSIRICGASEMTSVKLANEPHLEHFLNDIKSQINNLHARYMTGSVKEPEIIQNFIPP